MRYLLIVFLLFSYSFASERITYDYAFKGGINLSSYEKLNWSYAAGYQVGVTTSRNTEGYFLFGIDVMFAVKRMTFADIVALDRYNNHVLKMDYTIKANYIQIGIKPGFYLDSKKTYSLRLGPDLFFISDYSSSKELHKELTYENNQSYKYKYNLDEGSDPFLDIRFDICFRYDYQKYFIELVYEKSIFEQESFGNFAGINSTSYSIVVNLGYYFIGGKRS